jgi:hypothetical protein
MAVRDDLPPLRLPTAPPEPCPSGDAGRTGPVRLSSLRLARDPYVIGRDLAAALGALIVVVAGWSVIGTVVVPRAVRSPLTVLVTRSVGAVFFAMARRCRDTNRRDNVLAVQAPVVLIVQLVVWLAAFLVGFGLLMMPFTAAGFGYCLLLAGSAMSTIGFLAPGRTGARVLSILASFAALGTVALQIGYLPALYGAFNRREQAVALLNARAGVPAWGPELLARTHYGLGTGVSTIGTLPELYAEWERFAADLTESHATYPVLVWFRSPRPLSSWVTSLLAVLDSAALFLALSPASAPEVPARLCLRAGFLCFNRLARVLGFPIPEEASAEDGISLTFEDFLEAVSRLRSVEFPIERSPEEAWPHFVGWRVNYERAAFAIADTVTAPAALWSGPRRIEMVPIAPLRPPDRLQGVKLAPGKAPADDGSERRSPR